MISLKTHQMSDVVVETVEVLLANLFYRTNSLSWLLGGSQSWIFCQRRSQSIIRDLGATWGHHLVCTRSN